MTKKEKEKAGDQPNLFGEIEQVFNVLQNDLKCVDDDISSAERKILNLETDIEIYKIRRTEIITAIKTVSKRRKGIKQTPPKKEKKI